MYVTISCFYFFVSCFYSFNGKKVGYKYVFKIAIHDDRVIQKRLHYHRIIIQVRATMAFFFHKKTSIYYFSGRGLHYTIFSGLQ